MILIIYVYFKNSTCQYLSTKIHWIYINTYILIKKYSLKKQSKLKKNCILERHDAFLDANMIRNIIANISKK